MKQRYASTSRPYASISDRPASRITATQRQELTVLRHSLVAIGMALAIIIATSVASASDSSVGQHRYCNPKVSKPCGNGCILLAKACRLPWTTSIPGIKPRGAQASTTPEFVETAPTAAQK